MSGKTRFQHLVAVCEVDLAVSNQGRHQCIARHRWQKPLQGVNGRPRAEDKPKRSAHRQKQENHGDSQVDREKESKGADLKEGWGVGDCPTPGRGEEVWR